MTLNTKAKSLMLFLFMFGLSLAVFMTNGCNSVFINESAAANKAKSSPLRIGVHTDLIYKSIDKDLIAAFVKDYRLKARYSIFTSEAELSQAFQNKTIDMAVTRAPMKNYKQFAVPGPHYDQVQLAVFCKSKKINQVYIPEAYSVLKLEKDFSSEQRLHFVDGSLDEIIALSLENKNSCFVAESKQIKNFKIFRHNFKSIHHFSQQAAVAWHIQGEKTEVIDLAKVWFNRMNNDNKMDRFWDQHEAPLSQMTLLEYRRFKEDIKTILPKWKRTFEKYGRKYDIPWTLIAAVAYQESKWNADAVSYTGVKGFMQLTEKTAEHLGVEDREDPYQSIQGGSQYLQYLFEKSPKNLNTFERWVQALAGYNMGWAHLRDIRTLASHLNKNPYSWKDLKMMLPLKSDEKYRSHFNFGLARGEETVDFVENVLNYYQILNVKFAPQVAQLSLVAHKLTQQSQTSRDF